MKLCPRCNVERPLSDFHADKSRSTGLSSSCRECLNDAMRLRRLQNPAAILLITARQRATKQRVPFRISEADVQIPDRCPILGCHRPLVSGWGRGRGYRIDTPTLDKIVPSLGYIPNNVWVICAGCNRSKNDIAPHVARAVVREISDRGLSHFSSEVAIHG